MEQDFSRQKTLYIFGSTLDTIQKRRLFFHGQFSRQKTFANTFSLSVILRRDFPAKRLSFFSVLIAVGPFKSANL